MAIHQTENNNATHLVKRDTAQTAGLSPRNFSEVHQAYNAADGEYRPEASANFAKWSPAYVSTNEDVREALRILEPNAGGRVLTVTGSGDQALFYKLSGAEHVDTFDISYNAKMIMDIKTSAIANADYDTYSTLIRHIAKVPREITDILATSGYQPVKNGLTQNMQNYIASIRGLCVCRPRQYIDEILFKSEFAQLQKTTKENFHFIWSDLYSLSEKITGQYDQIYLSNILQYEHDTQRYVKIVSDLGQHLKPNGKMLVNIAPWFDEIDKKNIRALNEAAQRWAQVRFVKLHDMSMCILTKKSEAATR